MWMGHSAREISLSLENTSSQAMLILLCPRILFHTGASTHKLMPSVGIHVVLKLSNEHRNGINIIHLLNTFSPNSCIKWRSIIRRSSIILIKCRPVISPLNLLCHSLTSHCSSIQACCHISRHRSISAHAVIVIFRTRSTNQIRFVKCWSHTRTIGQ
jgi:hypothetical protein